MIREPVFKGDILINPSDFTFTSHSIVRDADSLMKWTSMVRKRSATAAASCPLNTP
jgi:hypothetical protein